MEGIRNENIVRKEENNYQMKRKSNRKTRKYVKGRETKEEREKETYETDKWREGKSIDEN